MSRLRDTIVYCLLHLGIVNRMGMAASTWRWFASIFFSDFGADHFPSIVPFKKVLENRPFFAPAPRYGFGAVIFAAITHNPTVMRGSFKADFIFGALGGITKTILGTTWHNLDIILEV